MIPLMLALVAPVCAGTEAAAIPERGSAEPAKPDVSPARARAVYSDPTILRYYTRCGRTDVGALEDANADTDAYDKAEARWALDADALEMGVVTYTVQRVNAAIDWTVANGTCRTHDFWEAVPAALAANQLLWPEDTQKSRVVEIPDRPDLAPRPWRRPLWTWIAAGGALALSGVSAGASMSAYDHTHDDGGGLAAARSSQDPEARRTALGQVRNDQVATGVGAAGAGIAMSVAVVVWAVRW